jgi:hypothetical protein
MNACGLSCAYVMLKCWFISSLWQMRYAYAYAFAYAYVQWNQPLVLYMRARRNVIPRAEKCNSIFSNGVTFLQP